MNFITIFQIKINHETYKGKSLSTLLINYV